MKIINLSQVLILAKFQYLLTSPSLRTSILTLNKCLLAEYKNSMQVDKSQYKKVSEFYVGKGGGVFPQVQIQLAISYKFDI